VGLSSFAGGEEIVAVGEVEGAPAGASAG
jgi:hypothetical protein